MAQEVETKGIPSIVELNRDIEPFIVQGTASRSVFFKDTLKPLQFVHFSDVHAIPEMWQRLTEYVNYYQNYISFALHTGDYCGGSQEQYFDCYQECPSCDRPIYNCVGNHDTYNSPKVLQSDKKTVYELLFNDTTNWDVEFMPGDYSMTYYKDFPESNIRLIVVDCYYDIEEQQKWVKEKLDEARTLGMHVLTGSHVVSSPITNKEKVTFQTLTDFDSIGGNRASCFLEKLLVEFKKSGGVHIANLVGHEHHDLFGHTDEGILNIAVECATAWNGWCDSKRVKGTRTYDCFNVVSIDPTLHIIKLVRVGDNADCYLRVKRTLCYDYVENRVIYNG